MITDYKRDKLKTLIQVMMASLGRGLTADEIKEVAKLWLEYYELKVIQEDGDQEVKECFYQAINELKDKL